MKPVDHYTNGDDGADSSEGSEADGEPEADELSFRDAEAPARALAALNALRKSRQHYDVVLVAGGAEVPAHRAVLAAASPYLLEALPASGPDAPHRLPHGVEPDALRALVEYAYSGRLAVRSASAARELYRAASRLRIEPARLHLAERLLRRLQPADCLAVRALPGLSADQLRHLDRYIADNFEEVWSCGALSALPQVRVEVLRESSAAGGTEAPLTVADAVLAWLRDQPDTDRDFAELCSRPHLVYVDARGALRDCGELPSVPGDAPELDVYRRDAATRKRAAAAASSTGPAAAAAAAAGGAGCVLAARRAGGGGTRALVSLGARLVSVRASWACGGAAGGGGAGGALAGGVRPARLAAGRAALGVAALAGRLLACGGYDRARVLRSVESYEPALNAWTAAADMRRERARFALASLGDTIYVIGGSDGHTELDSVDSYSPAQGWRACAPLPLAVAHAAAAAVPAGAGAGAGCLYVCGGWAGGGYLRRTWRYSPAEQQWSEAPALGTGRAQCGGAAWRGALWVLGGCDAWHCLASAERLPLHLQPDAGVGAEQTGWRWGPPLPAARRSMGCSVWRDRLVSAGGSDGAASLRRTDWLDHEDGPWRSGPGLRRARAGPGLAVLEEALYAVGGFDGKEFLACAECLTSPDGEWTALCETGGPPAPLPLLPLPLHDSPPSNSDAASPNIQPDALSEESPDKRNSGKVVKVIDPAVAVAASQ